MDIFLSIAAVVLGIVGIAGCIIPVLPGVILSFAGLLCSFFTSGTHISSVMVWCWLAIALIVSAVDSFLPAYMTKVFGGSRASMIGATVGLIAGLFLTPVGMIMGTFLGAVAGEMLNNGNNLARALKVGVGSFLSFIVGTGIKLVAALAMMFYICRDVFPSFASWIAGVLG